jgi:hypothetical protein
MRCLTRIGTGERFEMVRLDPIPNSGVVLTSPYHAVFQRAVAQAEYEAEKDEERGSGVLLTERHLQVVADLPEEFKNHLVKVHGQNEYKRARMRSERHDYDSDSESGNTKRVKIARA